MQVTALQDTNALLTYSLSTAPAPVQVSRSSTEPSYATLTFVVSNSGDDVTVNQIAFVLPVGDPSRPERADLTEKAKGIGYSVSDSAWRIGPGTVPGVFVLKPARGTPIVVGDQGIAVVLSNIDVSTVVGTATVTIREDASGGDGGQPEATRTCTLAAAKFPYGFAAGNFTVAAPLVQYNEPAVLSWFGTDAPGTTYTMFWGTMSTDVTKVREWPSPRLTETTVFLLEVQATTPGGTVRIRFSATQIVAEPDVIAHSLKVLGQTNLEGPATAHAVTAETVAAETATAKTATIASATIASALDARSSRIAALTAPQLLQPRAWTAPTDGFVVGVVSAPPPPHRTKRCVSTVTLSSGQGLTAQVTGGNLATAGGATAPVSQTGMIPVAGGELFVAAVHHDRQNEVDATCTLAWISLGSGTPR